MRIKVYNENGKVKVTKIVNTGIEQTMFSEIKDGEVAIIDVSTHQSISGEKNNTA